MKWNEPGRQKLGNLRLWQQAKHVMQGYLLFQQLQDVGGRGGGLNVSVCGVQEELRN